MTATPSRNIRIPDDLWHAAQTKAAANYETVTAVIIRALVDYTKKQRMTIDNYEQKWKDSMTAGGAR